MSLDVGRRGADGGGGVNVTRSGTLGHDNVAGSVDPSNLLQRQGEKKKEG